MRGSAWRRVSSCRRSRSHSLPGFSGKRARRGTRLRRDLDPEEIAAGEFFLTTPPTPYKLRGKVTSAENFESLLAYLGLPVFARALK
jgi:hypothetical protein